MTNNQLEISGVLLFKCEGLKLRKDKRYPKANVFQYAIEFTNSDPILIKLFLRFLREILEIEENKLKCEIFIYDDLNKLNLEQYWSEITNITKDRFHKTIILKAKNSKYKPNPRGTCKLRYFSKQKFLELNRIVIKHLGKEADLLK